MRKPRDIEVRLAEWGKHYASDLLRSARVPRAAVLGTFSSYGSSPLASLMKWHGRAPAGLGYEQAVTAADEVHQAVVALSTQEKGFEPAMVLRYEYGLPLSPREVKRQELARDYGLQMGDVRYCQHLRLAKIHVAAWLRIPFSEPLSDIERIDFLAYVEGVD